MEGVLRVAVGRNLRRVRRELGFSSQEAFGAHLNWHRTFVGALERGERNITLGTVERLCEQIGVHPLDLLWDQEGVGVTMGDDGRARFVERATPRPIRPRAAPKAGETAPPAATSPPAIAADRDPKAPGTKGGDPSPDAAPKKPIERRPRPRPD